MRVRKPFFCLVFLVICAGLLQSARAQSDAGQISGFVKDSSGAVIPGATVAIRNETTGLERQAVTNDSGYYVVPNLPPGYYTLAVELPGFKRFVKTRNKLDANSAMTIDAGLELGEVTETVQVVASTAQVQSETATVGRVIEEHQIKNLMLNGRNAILLALLKAGVRRGGAIGDFSFSMNSGGYAINGSRTQDNLITHDGAVATRTRANGTSIGAVDIDAVQEMQILTANYNAEYGRSNGGQIRIVTKSGSHDFHGSFYEYFRNKVLDANTWRRNRAGLERPGFTYNQFGYNVSGPVFIPGKWNTDKSKLFFLWTQEWVRFRQESTSTATVPSLQMRQGDFSELLDPNNIFFSGTRVITDPETGEPFPNNIISAGRLSANGIGLLNAFPEPTPGFLQGSSNFIQTRPQPTDQRKDTVAIDYNPAIEHAFRFRFHNYNFKRLDAFRSGFDLAVTDWDRPNKTGALNYTWTINPTTINEFVATASVDRVFIGIQQDGLRFARSQFGIDYPYIFPERKEIPDKIPTVNISNFQRLDGGPYPAQSTGPIYQFANNTSKIVGNHTVKFGVWFERSGQNDFDQINVTGVPGGTNNQNGRFVFTDDRLGGTGLAAANAALGVFSTYAEIGPRAFTPYRGNAFAWFVQDSWKVNEKLRLELGLRHDLMTPYFYSLWRNMAVFDPNRYDPSRAVVQDPATGAVISGDRFNGVVIPGEGWPEAALGRVAIADSGEFNHLFTGGDKSWGEYQKANFQPRIGIAYQLDSQTVVRAGFGRFMARPGVADNIFLGGNPPFQPMVSISNGQVDNPAGGSRTNFPQFFMTMDSEYKIPSAYNWNLTVQREIGFETTVEVAYVGRAGTHLERTRELNALPIGTRTNSANNGLDTNFLRPFKGFSFINLGENAARSEYHGLQVQVNRRFSEGFSYGIAYTLSKSEDNASGRRDQCWNPFDDTLCWGASSFDSRHVAVMNFIYELPFLRANRILGGWQVTGVLQFQTGSPFTIGRGEDRAGIGSGNQFQPWEVRGDPVLDGGQRAFSQGKDDANFWFQTVNSNGDPIFAAPAAGTFSTTQNRNMWYHPGFQSWNAAIFKDFGITENQSFQVRAEFFNFPNHPNWDSANTNPSSATFGKVTAKEDDRRQVQLSLRYSF
ncbi:MAG: TonB-dependent receptor domain-containing protein [Acidobacteriota bacterium]